MEEKIKQTNPTLHRYLFTVTTFSKLLAMFLFVLLPFVGFYLGMIYQANTTAQTSKATTVQKANTQNIVTTKKNSEAVININKATFSEFCKLSYCPENKTANKSPDLSEAKFLTFSFEYPKDWTLSNDYSKDDGSNINLVLKKEIKGTDPSGEPHIYTSEISIIRLNTTLTLENWYKIKFANSEYKAYNDNAIQNAKPIMLDGLNGLFWSPPGSGGYLGYVTAILQPLQKAKGMYNGYYITLSGLAGQVEDAEAFYSVLSTFKFIN